MPSKSKAKGNRFEREIVNICSEHDLNAKRAWGSNGAAIGEHEEVDVVIEPKEDGPRFKIQAKCRKKLADFLQPTEHVDAVVCKQDRGEVLIIMNFKDFLMNHYMMPMYIPVEPGDSQAFIEMNKRRT